MAFFLNGFFIFNKKLVVKDYELSQQKQKLRGLKKIKCIVFTAILEVLILSTIFLSMFVIAILTKFEVMQEMFEDGDNFNKHQNLNLLTLYGPTIALYFVEMIIPSFFEYLKEKQLYLERTKIKLQLMRKTVLNIFSAFTYIIAILELRKCEMVDSCNVGIGKCVRILVIIYLVPCNVHVMSFYNIIYC